MSSIWAGDSAQRFYIGLSVVGLAAIALGFSTTYFGPVAQGGFHAPVYVHLHGLFAASWVALLGTQATLVRRGNTQLHMKLGRMGMPLAFAIWASGLLTAAWATRRDLPQLGAVAEASLAGTFNGLTAFLLIVIIAIIMRRRPAAHKRLMALATIVLLWPAVFRWRHIFPPSERPDILYGMLIANLPILIAMLRDRFRYGYVHPVWLIGGTLWFVEQSIEVLMFDTLWNAPVGRILLTVIP